MKSSWSLSIFALLFCAQVFAAEPAKVPSFIVENLSEPVTFEIGSDFMLGYLLFKESEECEEYQNPSEEDSLDDFYSKQVKVECSTLEYGEISKEELDQIGISKKAPYRGFVLVWKKGSSEVIQGYSNFASKTGARFSVSSETVKVADSKIGKIQQRHEYFKMNWDADKKEIELKQRKKPCMVDLGHAMGCIYGPLYTDRIEYDIKL